MERRSADSLTLKLGVDHEAPQADLRYGPKRLIAKHDEPRGGLANVDGAIPSFVTEESLCERDGVAGDEPLLIRTD